MKNTNDLHILPPGYKNVTRLERLLKIYSEEYWIKKSEKRVMRLFRLMSQRVPAYKDFLKRNKIHPGLIRTVEDLSKIPTVDKNNYLRNYPLAKLCWDGKFNEKRWTISTNSGSTGETLYFPREQEQDIQYSITAELYMRSNFNIKNRNTLYVNTFAMGSWIGGVFTYEAVRMIAERGKYKLSIITPGIFKEEILKTIKNLGDKFDQIIIGGYPPFVKDVIDEGIKIGIIWKDYRMGFVFSAEGFTETFRDYIFERAGKDNPLLFSLNHYGTADMGTMSHETPISILVRRLALKNKKVLTAIFPEKNRLPTFTQYDPNLFYFQTNNNILCCSGYSGIPFIRYDLKDYGGLCTFSDIRSILGNIGHSLHDEVINKGISHTVWNLPFVYVYERNDFTVKLYGANIFPETIRHALQQKIFEDYTTGKFTMSINFDEKENQFLEIQIELMKNVKPTETLIQKLQKHIVRKLLEENFEYKSNFQSDPHRQTPKISTRIYEDPAFFKPGKKQIWVKKTD